MHFEILREQNLKDENRVKLKIKVEAPLRKTADVPYIVFNDQQKVVDFIIEKGYTFDRWTCLKAETVHNRGDESSRVKTWSFSLERFPKVTVQEKPKIISDNAAVSEKKEEIKNATSNKAAKRKTTTRRTRRPLKKED